MPMHPHLPHLLYALTITSLSVHLVNHRRLATHERAQLAAQISLLTTIEIKLKAPEFVPDQELDRLRRLAKSSSERAEEAVSGIATAGKGLGIGESSLKAGESISWKDVVLGNKDLIVPTSDEEELENLLKEIKELSSS